MTFLRFQILICALWLTSAAAHALETVDGEIGLTLWPNEFRTNALGVGHSDGALSSFGQAWWSQKWGIRGGMYRSDLDDLEIEDAQYLNFDVERRLFSPADDTFFAIGLGVEDIDLGQGLDSRGARFTLDGRAALFGRLSLYGQAAWYPSMEDVSGFDDIEGREFQAGISYDPAPFFSLRAGFKTIRLDFTDGDGLNNSSESKGFHLGGGLRW
ncbi:MAG: hypothetical protein OEU36_10665 [Gammaproteobacteria bacterium]|nr:hypothetical protein [Gammaproteobacteria bacterium]